jgi:hypothetical protein
MDVFMKMKKPTLSRSCVRDLLHERLDALLADCDTVMDNAETGQIIHDIDNLLFVEGKKFINEVLKEKLQERIEALEDTPETKECGQCKKKAHPRQIFTNHSDL